MEVVDPPGVLFLQPSYRKAAEEADAIAKQKQQQRSEAVVAADGRVAGYDDRVSTLEESVDMWSSILGYISSIDTHGSKKPSEQTWKQYFEQGLEKELEVPLIFLNKALPFHDALMEVSKVLGSVQMELAKVSNQSQRTKQRMAKRKEVEARKEERASRKVQQLVNKDDFKEAQRILAWI